jgi:hypothetical protein
VSSGTWPAIPVRWAGEEAEGRKNREEKGRKSEENLENDHLIPLIMGRALSIICFFCHQFYNGDLERRWVRPQHHNHQHHLEMHFRFLVNKNR